MQEMNYFQILVWPGGGIIGLLLWMMSFLTLGIIVHYFMTIRREVLLPSEALKRVKAFFQTRQYRQAFEYIAAHQRSFFGFVLHEALAEAPHGYPAMGRAMEEAAEQRATLLLRRIEWLNLIGNISPMLGLLGTVWGMIGAFFRIVEAGGGVPDSSKLAGNIGIALVTTLLGLGVAIPSLAVYSMMRNRIDALSSEAIVICQELISTLRPTAAPKAPAASPPQEPASSSEG